MGTLGRCHFVPEGPSTHATARPGIADRLRDCRVTFPGWAFLFMGEVQTL